MKHLELMIALLAFLSFSAPSAAAQTTATQVEQGVIAEIRYRPFVFLDIGDRRQRHQIENEIYEDPFGQLVLINAAEQADFILAFITRPQDAPADATPEAAWIGSDHKGQMIAYVRRVPGRVRIVWTDPKGDGNPTRAVRELLQTLAQDRQAARSASIPSSISESSNKATASSDLLRPTFTYKERAPYTDDARRANVNGVVVLSLAYMADGTIRDVRVMRGLPFGLTANAIKAALKIRFKPATRNGNPINVRGQIEFKFSM